jgi:FkbH-like protein
MIEDSAPNQVRSALLEARKLIAQGEPRRALEMLGAVISPNEAAPVQAQYGRLARELAARLDHLPSVRIAFVAGVTLDHFVDALRYWVLQNGLRLESLIVPFGTGRQQIKDSDSDLYRFKPDIVWFFSHPNDLRLDPGVFVDDADGERIVTTALTTVHDDAATVAERNGGWVVANNLPAAADRVFGNLEGAVHGTSAGIVRRYNDSLAQALPTASVVFDIAHVAASFGLERWEDERLWCHSKHPFSLAANGRVAFAAARLVSAARGGARKCVVVDLDNTIWGGVVGDDGIDGLTLGVDNGAVGEAFVRFQRWLKALSARGIAVAVCSKNDPQIAREAFARHPGMVLTLDDVAVFRANWENKADNIRAIARELNIGLDAVVFVDDNPAERALVRAELPQVAVPEMPEDPAAFIATLSAGKWFETIGVSNEDRQRTASFRANSARAEAESSATDLPTYLRGLSMHAHWGAVNDATFQRVVQLINKTNQFHPTTTRYTAQDVQRMADSDGFWVGHFSLADRFGDNGIIAVAILRFEDRTAHIDTWAMSCRVFARTMEQFTFANLARVARARGCTRIVGAYQRTAKNGVVAELYPSLGGTSIDVTDAGASRWEFRLDQDLPTGSPFIEDRSAAEIMTSTTQEFGVHST